MASGSPYIGPNRLMSFRGVRLGNLVRRVNDCSLAEAKWNARIPPEIRPAAGERKTVPIKQLSKQQCLGASVCLDQFAYGFPIAGTLSRRFTYPEDGEGDARRPLAQLYQSDPARLRDRAAKSGQKDA